MKAIVTVRLRVEVNTEDLTMEGLVSHCKSINKLSEIFDLPSVDRDSIKLENVKVE